MNVKNGHIFRIVYSYKPFVKTTTSPIGLGTVNSQQISYNIRKRQTKGPNILIRKEVVWKIKKMESKTRNNDLNDGRL